MKTTSIARTFAVAIAASMLGASMSHAYVDIELDGGRHVKGESYSADAGKLVVYKPSGAVEIDRSTVRSIREVEGSLNETAPRPRHLPPRWLLRRQRKRRHRLPRLPPQTKDPKERENQLARQLMYIRLDRLAASQRGDRETAEEARQGDRLAPEGAIKNYKKIDPSFEVESSN